MIRRILLLLGISYGFHQLWESSHVGLYGGYEQLTTLPITVYATFGDVAYTLAAYFFIALFKRDGAWLVRMTKLDVAGVTVAGFFISLFVEYKALAFDRWFYLDAMPIIPGLQIGLTPVVQMTVLLPLTFYLVHRFERRFP
jgi:hypothetical protein